MPRRRRFRRSGPLVAPEVIDAYLGRKLNSYLWLKKAEYEHLLEGFEKHFPGKRRWQHQLTCFNIGVVEPRFGFFCEMGAGKSLIALDLFRYWRGRGYGKMLVVSPREVNVQTWLDECNEYAPGFKAVPLLGSAKERHAALKQDGDIYLISYPGLQTMMTALVRTGRGKRRQREIVPKIAEPFVKNFDIVVADESHKLGHHTTLVYHEALMLARQAKVFYELSGTPFGRDPMLLWSQFKLLDDGATLGKTLGLFRASFFHEKVNYWGVPEYTFDKALEKDLHRLIQNRSIFYSEDEFSDVPAVKHIRRRVNFPHGAEAQYKEMLRELRRWKGSVKEMESAFYRMRCVTSGYLAAKSEFDEKLLHDFSENPKLEELLCIVDEMPVGKKFIVYHDYVHTGDIIAKAFDDLDIPYARIGGKVKDQAHQLNRFLHEPGLPLIANSETAGTGTNLQKACHYAIYYESPVSPITRKQSEKRIARQGQQHHVYIYDLVIRGTVDEDILESLEEGKDLFDAICRGKKLMSEK